MYRAHIAVSHDGTSRREQTCTEHSRAAAMIAKADLEACGLGEAGYLAGLLHDCGKFTQEFDSYLEKAVAGEKVRRGSVVHTFAGVRYLLEQFHTQEETCKVTDIAPEAMAIAIGSHHGLIDLWDENHHGGFKHRRTHQPEYDDRAIAAFHAQCADEQEIKELFDKAQEQIRTFYKKKVKKCGEKGEEREFALGLLARLITSAVADGDRTDTRCFMQGLPLPEAFAPKWEECAAQVDAFVAAFPGDTPIQRARRVFSDQCASAAERESGLYRLDLPTGGGKTLAALRFAVRHAMQNGMKRVIYTAPLLSIIEQNAKVIRSAVGESAPVLEHHSNLILEKESSEQIEQTELLQETWDSQIIITTFVQLLNTLFSGKMSCVRRFQCLCESVIIIDEVQSLPPKMLSMFNIAVNFLVKCCGATVLLCSATQPAFDMATHGMLECKRLIGEDVLEEYKELFRRTKIQNAGSCKRDDMAGHAQRILETCTSLLIVCNTKRDAAKIFRAVKEQLEGTKVFHLSAGMCMAHRKKTLAEMNSALEAGERMVCVSTQLIEAGVDVSFSAVIRLAAGLDNIVQTAGRCNRHGEHEQPQPVYIYSLQDEDLGPLKEIEDAQNALGELLEEFEANPAGFSNDLTSDAAIRCYYEALYFAMDAGAQDYPIQKQRLRLFDLLSRNIQFRDENESNYYRYDQAFGTAGKLFEVFDSANESVLVPYEKGAWLIEELGTDKAKYDMGYADSLLEQAKAYVVSLSAGKIRSMEERGQIYRLLEDRVYILNDGCYNAQLGVWEEEDECSTLIL